MNRRRVLLTVALTAALAFVLHRLGAQGALPLTSPRDLSPWIQRQGTDALAAELARLAAFALAAYVTVVGVVALLRDVLHVRSPRAGRLTPAIVRRVLGLGVAGALVVPGIASSAPATTDVPVLVRVDAAPTSPSTSTPPPPTLVRVDDAASVPSLPSMPPPSVGGASMWRVGPGDHFWSIAESTVRAHTGAATDESSVARYWRTLVDANRERLVVAGNPDLVFPGQELVLPPVR